jgi:hypothetical protein
MLKSLIVLTGLYALTVSGCSTSPYTAYPHYREFQVSDHDVLILLDIRVEREDLPEEEVERILNMGGEVLGYADMVLRLKGYEKRKMMLVSVRVFNGSGRRGGSTGSNENGMVYIDPAFTVSEEMQTAVLGTLQSVHVRRKSARSPNIHIPETKKIGEATGAGAVMVLQMSLRNVGRLLQTLQSSFGDLLYEKTGLDYNTIQFSDVTCELAVIETLQGEMIWADRQTVKRDSFGSLAYSDILHAFEIVLDRLPD